MGIRNRTEKDDAKRDSDYYNGLKLTIQRNNNDESNIKPVERVKELEIIKQIQAAEDHLARH